MRDVIYYVASTLDGLTDSKAYASGHVLLHYGVKR